MYIRCTCVGQYSWSEVVLRDPHEQVAFNTVEPKAKFQKMLSCVSSSHILQALRCHGVDSFDQVPKSVWLKWFSFFSSSWMIEQP